VPWPASTSRGSRSMERMWSARNACCPTARGSATCAAAPREDSSS
jgi:hypothetical protein